MSKPDEFVIISYNIIYKLNIKVVLIVRTLEGGT